MRRFQLKIIINETADRPSEIVETQKDQVEFEEISFEQEKEQQSLSIIEKKIIQLKMHLIQKI